MISAMCIFTLLSATVFTGMASPLEEVDVSQRRRPYSSTVFTEDQLVSQTDPFRQFHAWFQDVLDRPDVLEPQAVCLSTCTSDGKPSSRMVLMKRYSEDGFVFFSNHGSRKGIQLAENPNACLLFFWPSVHRQVRIEGTVGRLSEEESTAYFNSRPRSSQISAAVSPQSSVITGRTELERKHQELMESYPEGGVPKPAAWGGYLLSPVMFEFWQGQSNRLHDRIVFSKESGLWTLKRLAP